MFRVNITYQSNVYWTAHHCNSWRMKDQLDVTCYFFFLLLMCKTNTTQNQPHQISNIQRTENKTTDVVIRQHSRKLHMMDILMSETCWAHKKWNKTASGIKLVFHSSTTYTGLRIKYQLILSNFRKLKFSRQIFEKHPNILDMRDMVKLMVGFRISSKAPKIIRDISYE